MSHAALLVAIEGGSRNTVEARVEEMMSPFQEDGWFADGSRWDWYEIGGRYSGKFMGEDVIQHSEFDPVRFRGWWEGQLRQCYQKTLGNKYSAEARHLFYGIKDGESCEAFVERSLRESGSFPTFYAFLRGYTWHEQERMGWFAGSAATECERKAEGNGRSTKKCTYKHPDGRSRIVSHGCTEEQWDRWFYRRFVLNLPPHAWLVTVDYHV